jgi:hypothetical protein
MTFCTKVQFSALVLIVAAVLASGCGSDNSNSITAPSGLDLTGAWTGTFGSNTDGTGGSPATWAATQSGTSSTGKFSLTFEEDDGSSMKIDGTLAGAISGTQVAWSLAFPAGTFTAVGVPTCSITGTGTSSAATTSSLAAALTITFSQACVGTISDGDQTSEVNQLKLTK